MYFFVQLYPFGSFLITTAPPTQSSHTGHERKLWDVEDRLQISHPSSHDFPLLYSTRPGSSKTPFPLTHSLSIHPYILHPIPSTPHVLLSFPSLSSPSLKILPAKRPPPPEKACFFLFILTKRIKPQTPNERTNESRAITIKYQTLHCRLSYAISQKRRAKRKERRKANKKVRNTRRPCNFLYIKKN